MSKSLLVRIALTAVLSLGCLFASAQGVEIKGTVKDDTGPVVGATVIIKGTSVGTSTGQDGSYKIKTQSPSDVLVFSFIGYDSEEVAANGKTVVDVVLEKSSLLMDDLVVIGYGVQRKSHLTGAITKFDPEAIASVPAPDITTALQGRLSGVTIQNLTSEVGAIPEIRIRGGGSITASKYPLIIVDGFEMENGLQMLSPSDIASIEVLKDASSSAIYGSKAASGVIMITTKEGQEMKPRYTLQMYHGVKRPYMLHELTTYGEYVDRLIQEREWGGNKVSDGDLAAQWIERNNSSNDWQRMGLRDNAYTDNINFSISGGRSKLKYYVSGAVTLDDGLMKQNYNNKYNFRSKLDSQLGKVVSIGTNISMTYTETERPTNNYVDFMRFQSWLPVRHNEFTSSLTGQPIGSYAHPAHFNTGTLIYPVGPPDADGNPTLVKANPYNSSNKNPLSILEHTYNTTNQYQLAANMYMNINILKNLVFRTANSITLRYSANETYSDKDAKGEDRESEGIFKSTLSSKWQTENTLSYIWKSSGHEVNVMGGFSAEESKSMNVALDGIGFPTDYIQTLNAATSFKVTDDNGKMLTGTYKAPPVTMASFFGRVNYSYLDRYLFSGVLRADGSSVFGADNKWGYFPSVSLGWRVSEEEFMKSVKAINSLKVRLSYGVTGNNRISSTASINLLYPASYSFGKGTGALSTGLANTSTTMGNPNLMWEQVYEYDAGIDLSMFKNRIVLTLDGYYSITKQMLFERPASSITGHTSAWTNLGKVRNEGIEISLDTHNFMGKEFKWTTSLNFSLNRNRLLDLGGEASIQWEGYSKERYINVVGQPTLQFYGWKTDGIFLSAEDVANSVKYVTDSYNRPGTLKAVDVYPDNKIDDKDRTVIGNPYPDFTWGITNTFTYKGFDLAFLFQGVQGWQLINADATYNDLQRRGKKFNIQNRWASEDHIGDGKTPTGLGVPWIETDYDVEDASYLCLRNVTLGYTLPAKVTKKIQLSKVRFYLSGNNLWYVINKEYRGINPEYRNTNSPYNNALVGGGYQRGGFPMIVTVTAGLDINF